MSINFKKLSKKQIIIIAVVAVFVIVFAAAGIYCAVNDETPAEMFSDMVHTDETLIQAKWQSEEAVSAYEFYEDGTYDNYISTFSFTGEYRIDGNKIILTNPNSNGSVTYKFSINGDTLKMNLVDENGTEPEDKETTIFKKVDHFNMKSFTDILEDAANEKENSEEETTEK